MTEQDHPATELGHIDYDIGEYTMWAPMPFSGASMGVVWFWFVAVWFFRRLGTTFPAVQDAPRGVRIHVNHTGTINTNEHVAIHARPCVAALVACCVCMARVLPPHPYHFIPHFTFSFDMNSSTRFSLVERLIPCLWFPPCASIPL